MLGASGLGGFGQGNTFTHDFNHFVWIEVSDHFVDIYLHSGCDPFVAIGDGHPRQGGVHYCPSAIGPGHVGWAENSLLLSVDVNIGDRAEANDLVALFQQVSMNEHVEVPFVVWCGVMSSITYTILAPGIPLGLPLFLV
jgi:hypothetical protein